MGNIQARAEALFNRARSRLPTLLAEMHAEHSKLGRLQSGLTVRRSIEIFEQASKSALEDIEIQVAGSVQSRGRRWKAAFAGIEGALFSHLQTAPELLRASIQMGTKDGIEIALPLLDESKARLLEQLHEFRDGWTAPSGRPWRERHAFWYAVLLLLVGALLTSLATLAGTILTDYGKNREAVTK